MSKAINFPVVLLVSIGLSLSACGGGSGGGSGGGEEALPAKTLHWSPPVSYTDGSPLDPSTDLDRFEIYVNEDGTFSDTDQEMAGVAASDPNTGQTVTSFNLANLSPFISKGIVYHVSVRAVAVSGLKSDFSSSASFSF